jgi:hypothetical protein
MKIEIKSADVNVKSGVSKKNGKPYTIREQVGYLHQEGEAYPVRCVLALEDQQESYAPGVYETANELYVGDFGRLAVSRSMRLVSVSARRAA